jgi:hypothetical protein
MVYPPVLSVCAVRSADVAVFLAETNASGTTPPELSRTVPAIVPVSAWPNARTEKIENSRRRYKKLKAGLIDAP